MKVNEIVGTGSHNTAEFWEYDTRIGRRWNLDPKPQFRVSDYAAFADNPVWKNDLLGNVVKVTSEVSKIVDEGLKSTVSEAASVVAYKPNDNDPKEGMLTFDDNAYEKLDKSKLNKNQLAILDRYKIMIRRPEILDVKLVENSDPIPGHIGRNGEKNASLEQGGKYGAYGVSIPYGTKTGEQTTISTVKIYIARNPVDFKRRFDGGLDVDITGTPKMTVSPEYRNSITLFHELLGHGFLYITQPNLSQDENNKKTTNLESGIRQMYMYNGRAVGGFSLGH